MKDNNSNLMKDLAIIAFSVLIAILMVKTGALKTLLVATQEIKFIGSFIAGIFFVSIFISAPSTLLFS